MSMKALGDQEKTVLAIGADSLGSLRANIQSSQRKERWGYLLGLKGSVMSYSSFLRILDPDFRSWRLPSLTRPTRVQLVQRRW